MNRSKLTPCRKVGLSRKKNTPLKTVEGLLDKKENTVAEIPIVISSESVKKTGSPKLIAKSEVNSDTPCRQVGLSRKRKTATPLGNFGLNKNVCTPSPSNIRITKNKPSKIIDNSANRDKVIEKKEEIGIPKLNEENHVSCAKRLSNLFSSPSIAKRKQNEVKYSEDTYPCEENRKSDHDYENVICPKNKSSKSLSDSNIQNIEQNKLPSNHSINIEGNELNNKNIFQSNTVKSNKTIKCDKNKHDLIGLTEEISQANSTRSDEDLKTISHNESQFLKVCYSDMKVLEKTQSKDFNPKTKIFSYHLFDDDDFEIGPRQKKTKICFERSKTDVIKKEKKPTKSKLKKCLSVGDSRSRTLTDSSIISNSSSMNLVNECFVILEPMRESENQQSHHLTPQDHSDDDFEALTCTPKENKINNLNSLEKEVEKKRQILDELKRAKIHKKMHNVEDLKELTARWKTGCLRALQDLLKQLNMHSKMTMEILLKKLNIPEDFVPLSQ